MSIGGIFILVSFILWFLMGIGVHTIPGVDPFAHASLALGILLSGIPVPWRVP